MSKREIEDNFLITLERLSLYQSEMALSLEALQKALAANLANFGAPSSMMLSVESIEAVMGSMTYNPKSTGYDAQKKKNKRSKLKGIR